MSDKTENHDPLAAFLHYPARADSMHSLEDHLNKAADLSRALWLLLSTEESFVDLSDKRNAVAVAALADLVADHASAAEYAFSSQDLPARPRVVAGAK